MNLGHAVWTDHARQQARRRGIDEATVQETLRKPGEFSQVREGRVVVQRGIHIEERRYLLRIFVDVDREPPEIVTVYRTSKLVKYEGRP